MTLRLVTIVGARPQFVKAAAVSRAIRNDLRSGSLKFKEVLLHTGQHYDQNMSQVFFDELNIPYPDYNLGVGSLPHGAQTGRMLEKIEEVLLKEKPNWVLPVAHIEAGLRSHNRSMPEEINRILADHVSDLLLAPTETAVTNLRHEGIAEDRIHLVGDVMYDAVLYYQAKAQASSHVLERLQLGIREYVLATIHRAENTDASTRLQAIMAGLGRVAEEVPVVCPLHPRTRAILEREGIPYQALKGVRFIDPVGYLDMIMLESAARMIVTDSGGVQKEAYWFGVPCATCREETEWVETVQTGWNVLLGADSERIGTILRSFTLPSTHPLFYGDGHAAERCLALLR
jgi:UDP-GlcNAc3NAcA epimerase